MKYFSNLVNCISPDRLSVFLTVYKEGTGDLKAGVEGDIEPQDGPIIMGN